MAGAEFASIPAADLIAAAGKAARGLYVATLAVPRGALPLSPAGRRIAHDIEAERPGVLEAAQATELVLSAIARSDGTRASVLEQLRAIQVSNGILGTFRFDRNGDMTPGRVPIVRVTGRTPPSRGLLSSLDGAVLERVVTLPPSLAG
jgi:ABC-type branched-subunit amino acid transport system substrate-binding protein